MENVRNQTEFGNAITLCTSAYEALDGADALLIMTEWPQFRTPDFEQMQERMKNNIIFDGRNLYDLGQMQELGFTYYSIGRQKVVQVEH